MTVPLPVSPFSVQRSAFNVERSLPSARGFTLVETALALLAISLGLLGIFGLARHGLKSAGDAEQETRCTSLAETITATLQAKNEELIARKVSILDWWTFWALFEAGTSYLYLPGMLEVSQTGEPVRLCIGKTTLNAISGTSVKDVKWSPVFELTRIYPSNDITELASLFGTDVSFWPDELVFRLTMHPGEFQSGAEQRTYTIALRYRRELP